MTGSALLDRRAAATLDAAQQWVSARADRRAIDREKRKLFEVCREAGWSSFTPEGRRLREVEHALAAAKKRERQALEAVAKACGTAPRRTIAANAREVEADCWKADARTFSPILALSAMVANPQKGDPLVTRRCTGSDAVVDMGSEGASKSIFDAAADGVNDSGCLNLESLRVLDADGLVLLEG